MAIISNEKLNLTYYEQALECRISAHDSLHDNKLGYDYLLTFDKSGFSTTVHINEQSLVDLHEALSNFIDRADERDSLIEKPEEEEEDNREDYEYGQQVQARLDKELFNKTGGEGNE